MVALIRESMHGGLCKCYIKVFLVLVTRRCYNRLRFIFMAQLCIYLQCFLGAIMAMEQETARDSCLLRYYSCFIFSWKIPRCKTLCTAKCEFSDLLETLFTAIY